MNTFSLKYFAPQLLFIFCSVLFYFIAPATTHATGSLSLSVTPPFTQMVLTPGEVFRSYVKVVNVNPYELTVYATPVNFSSSDEEGNPKFIPLVGDPVDKATLAGWIDVSQNPIVIPRESTQEVPFTINVPQNAPPGGHFAAILIGTKPPKDGSNIVHTAQVVTSLFLARVAGDVREEGQIRELSAQNSYSGTPRTEFSLRFENNGNVYLQPQGDITIYNMWGTERGFIPINQSTNFGNVLPKSIRKFSFIWEGTPSFTDIGRYKAIATLTFGVDAKHSVDRTIYFWVIPLKATLITLALFFGFFTFLVFAIRMYIRRVLQMAGVGEQSRMVGGYATRAEQVIPPKRTVTKRELVAPLRAGVLDLRKTVVHEQMSDSQPLSIVEFLREYRRFFLALTTGFLGLSLIVWYVVDARTTARPYEVTMHQANGDVTLHTKDMGSSRAVALPQTGADTGVAQLKQQVAIVNASGPGGASSRVVARLEKEGFAIGDISTDKDLREKSVIITNESDLQGAKRISVLLGDVPLSIRPKGEEAEPSLLLIIGKDQNQ